MDKHKFMNFIKKFLNPQKSKFLGGAAFELFRDKVEKQNDLLLKLVYILIIMKAYHYN
jgi:hypothetical protein